jgi:hypothetical protein
VNLRSIGEYKVSKAKNDKTFDAITEEVVQAEAERAYLQDDSIRPEIPQDLEEKFHEITKLYVRAITVTVMVSLVASLPFVIKLCDVFVKLVMDRYSGNLELYIELPLMGKVVAIGAVAYLVVAAAHIWHIRRVSLSEAMKVQE